MSIEEVNLTELAFIDFIQMGLNSFHDIEVVVFEQSEVSVLWADFVCKEGELSYLEEFIKWD